VLEMRVCWPLKAALQEEALNHCALLRLPRVVVSGAEKAS
jgi:hypothetical protein